MLVAYADDGIVTVMSEIYERTSEHEWNYEVVVARPSCLRVLLKAVNLC